MCLSLPLRTKLMGMCCCTQIFHVTVGDSNSGFPSYTASTSSTELSAHPCLIPLFLLPTLFGQCSPLYFCFWLSWFVFGSISLPFPPLLHCLSSSILSHSEAFFSLVFVPQWLFRLLSLFPPLFLFSLLSFILSLCYFHPQSWPQLLLYSPLPGGSSIPKQRTLGCSFDWCDLWQPKPLIIPTAYLWEWRARGVLSELRKDRDS